MILVAFFLVSLFPFFFVKDQIASFQLKEIVVFLNYVIATEFEVQPGQSTACS